MHNVFLGIVAAALLLLIGSAALLVNGTRLLSEPAVAKTLQEPHPR
jgi:hypothetical protein